MELELNIQNADPVNVQIERFLGQCIRDGRLQPEDRLPTTEELVRTWRVDRMAVQKAMTHLAANGLIERRRHHGTFVKATTAKAVIGVLVGPSLVDESAYSYRAMVKAIRAEIADMEHRQWTFRVYDGWGALKSRSDFRESHTYQHFIHDLRNNTFKGIVKLHGSVSLDEKTDPGAELPTVRLGPPFDLPETAVMQDTYCMSREVVKFIAQRGHKKIAYLRMNDNRFHPYDLDGLADGTRALKLPKVEVSQCENIHTGGAVMERDAHERTLQLVEAWQRSGRFPDALFVSDDIAMRGVALALVRKGIEVPGRLLVVTFANEGIHHHYGVPVVRYEFSVRALAKAMLDLLWRQIAKEPLPDLPFKLKGQIKASEGL